MLSQPIAGLTLFYDPAEQEAAGLIAGACRLSAGLFARRWGLAVPRDCRVYVMSSGLGFLFRAAPWPWKLYLLFTLPWVLLRVRAIWDSSGGWAFSFGSRRVVGIKPPRLLQHADRSPGSAIYAPGRSLEEIVQTITCHELAHAFTAHLRLPPWLHEGLAMLAMDGCLGRPVLRVETLDRLERLSQKDLGRRPQPLRDRETVLDLYTRGYWLARTIDETMPDLMRDLLAERRNPEVLEDLLAGAFGGSREQFWAEIDARLVDHYRAGRPSSPR